MNTVTPIHVGVETDETLTVHVGHEKSPGWRKQETAAEVARIVRLAYAQGRADQRAETSAIVRGVLGV